MTNQEKFIEEENPRFSEAMGKLLGAKLEINLEQFVMLMNDGEKLRKVVRDTILDEISKLENRNIIYKNYQRGYNIKCVWEISVCVAKAKSEELTDEQKAQIQAQMQADFEAEMQRLEPELYQI